MTPLSLRPLRLKWHEVPDQLVDIVLQTPCPGGATVMAFLPMRDGWTATDGARDIVRTMAAAVINALSADPGIAACLKAHHAFDSTDLEQCTLDTLPQGESVRMSGDGVDMESLETAFNDLLKLIAPHAASESDAHGSAS
jgi:hypothetical protein